MTEQILDTRRLATQTIPLQFILFLSTIIGVALGIGILFVIAAIGTAFVPGGFFAWIAAILAVGVYGVQLVAAGIAAIVLIPLGAIIASHLKLRASARYIIEESGATVLPDSNRAGTVVATMSRKAGLPGAPRYAILENEFNAFAMSASHEEALVMIGRPLQKVLGPKEIMAIIGHELGHVAMGDSKRKLLAKGHQDFLVVFLGLSGLRKMFRAAFGLVGELALAAHSREREYWADAVGAYLTSTEDMVSALRKINEATSPPPTALEKSYAHLMLRSPRSEWFSTHPTMDQRIAALLDGDYVRRLPLREAPLPEAAEMVTPARPLSNYDGV